MGRPVAKGGEEDDRERASNRNAQKANGTTF